MLSQADEAILIGPAALHESYLSVERIMAAAERSGAEAIHPGYGFLSESPELARACESAGIAFIGPSAKTIEMMGDKIQAKMIATAAGVPTVPGLSEPNLSDEQLRRCHRRGRLPGSAQTLRRWWRQGHAPP